MGFYLFYFNRHPSKFNIVSSHFFTSIKKEKKKTIVPM